jgi:hypothetical protein
MELSTVMEMGHVPLVFPLTAMMTSHVPLTRAIPQLVPVLTI